jgi:NAD(P)-dependent dehydrogenase (short-subunit alcohol dehydrogenase family)
MFSLANKLALVTGAARGIGFAIGQRLQHAGAHVICADLNDSEQRKQSGMGFIQLDVSDETNLRDALQHVCGEHDRKLDILINNAGIALPEPAIEDLTLEQFDKTLSVNLHGVLLGLKHGPKHMNDGGRIINTASLAAFANMPAYAAYATSKSGVVKLTEVAALELGKRRITVNAVCPGTTITDMEPADGPEAHLAASLTALGRAAQPEEIAPLYHFLASDEAAYISGQAICIDGGWLHGATDALLTTLTGEDNDKVD